MGFEFMGYDTAWALSTARALSTAWAQSTTCALGYCMGFEYSVTKEKTFLTLASLPP